MAKLAPTPYPGFDQRSDESVDAWLERTELMLDELEKHSVALPEGSVVGGVLRFQVADSYAIYLVVADAPLTLQHIPFLDGYAIPAPYLRGLEHADVVGMLANDKAWSRFR